MPQKTSSALTENESAGPSEKSPRLVRNDRVNEFWGNIRWDFLSVRKKVQAKSSFLSAASELSAIPGRFAPEGKKAEPRRGNGSPWVSTLVSTPGSIDPGSVRTIERRFQDSVVLPGRVQRSGFKPWLSPPGLLPLGQKSRSGRRRRGLNLVWDDVGERGQAGSPGSGGASPYLPAQSKNHPNFVFRMHPIDFSQRFILC